jgi:hypothetical protein
VAVVSDRGPTSGVSGIAERTTLNGALSVYPAKFNALSLNLKVLEVGASELTVYYLREGFKLMVFESMMTESASLLPVSL